MTRPVVVLDGFWRKTVALVRGLSRGGERVWCGEVTRTAPALWSTGTGHAFTYPSPLLHPDRFVERLTDVIQRSRTDVVLVGEMATLDALRQLEVGLPGYPTIFAPRPDLVKRLGNKACLADHARARGLPIPRTWVFGPGSELPEEVSFPARWKPAEGEGGAGQQRFESRSRWRAAAPRRAGILQEELPPPVSKVGLGLLVASSRILASFAYRKLRELHPAGGASTLRISIDDAPYLEVARALIADLDYTGFLHVEFFDYEDGRPVLIEANPRPWGSLALALESGVNFAALAVAHLRGIRFEKPRYRRGVRVCWLLPGDLLARVRSHEGSLADWSGVTFDLLRDDDPLPAVARVFSGPWWLGHPHFRALRRLRCAGDDAAASRAPGERKPVVRRLGPGSRMTSRGSRRCAES